MLVIASSLLMENATSLIYLSLCLFLQEHTGYVYGLQFDAVQVISGSHDGTLLTYDFLDPTPPILST